MQYSLMSKYVCLVKKIANENKRNEWLEYWSIVYMIFKSVLIHAEYILQFMQWDVCTCSDISAKF